MMAAAALFVLALVPHAARAAGSQSLATVLDAEVWLNDRPTASSVQGKVVLVDFYTFACINCKHVEPNLRKLHASEPSGEFAIIGVHSPETPYERNLGNVLASTKQQGVVWPVAIDNDFTVWNAYAVSAWPTQLIFDRHGRLRATIVGEGQDALVNRTIANLLSEK